MPTASLLTDAADAAAPRKFAGATILLALPGLLLTLVFLVPFLGKAFTIDDQTFLLEARQILKTPLHPLSFPICYGDDLCVRQAGNMGANAREGLMGYVLVPVILTHGAEWLAHSLQIVLACLAVLQMVRLARRLKFSSIQVAFAGVLLASIPPFLSMASTAMPDILALTLALTGLERLAAWRDERRWHQAMAAGIALGLAPYARPHVALLLPLGALWLFDDFRLRKVLKQFRQQTELWAPILMGVLVLFVVNFATRVRDTGLEPKNTLVGPENILRNLITYLHYLAFPIPFAGVWLSVNWRRSKIFFVVPAALIGLRFGWLVGLQTVAVLCGLVSLVDLISSCLAARDRIGGLLSLWVLMPLPAVIYLHLPLKYMLAVSPAIILLLIRTLASVSQTRALLVYGAVILGCAGYSLLLLEADADFAESGRKAASELIAPRIAAGEKVWFSGQWGFYWYAEEAGAKITRPDEPGPYPGELLVVGLMEGGNTALKRFPNRELVGSKGYDTPHGRTMGYGAGLYSNAYGILPWRWNPSALNVYEVWRIR
jgi:Dolichyl-phosphate-mannose-protein mannosyltransferase